MLQLQILFFLSLLASIPRASAYNYVIKGCQVEEKEVEKRFKISRFIDEFVADAADLAKSAYNGWLGSEAPIGVDYNELKARRPLIPDLFGSITAQEWVDIDHVIIAALDLASEKKSIGPAKVLISCEEDMGIRCASGALMQTLRGEGGDAAKDLILLCPPFWEDVLGQVPMYYGLLADTSIPVCNKKPIDLGATFAGRLYYHETIHTLTGTCPEWFPEDDWDFKDRGYLVDEDAKQIASTGIRVGSVEHTFYSKQNPDTYSFWALLYWQQKVCNWQPTWPWDDHIRSPMFTIPTVRGGGAGLYGPKVDDCPGRPFDPVNGVWLTKPTEDVVRGRTGKQAISWCKLLDQSKQCTGDWVRQQIEVLKDGQYVSLWGCFRPSAISLNSTLGDEQWPPQEL